MNDTAIYCEKCGSPDIRWMESELDEIDGDYCAISNTGTCGACGAKNRWIEVYGLERIVNREYEEGEEEE